MRSLVAFSVLGVLVTALIGALSYGGFRYTQLDETHKKTQEELASTSAAYALLVQTAAQLQQALSFEQTRNGTFESQISKISSTVGTLDKLAKTDKELLAKYSKVYFLSEHYVPTSLSNLPEGFSYPPDKELQIHTKVLPHLEALMTAAQKDDVDLRISSSYRSFNAQASLKTSYKVQYGKGANTFSADQGYSEHQLGTTVDFTTEHTKGSLVGFDATPAYAWLSKNAHKYGFILSYPKGNTYYQYEPWHWRYVGVSLATRLYQDEDYFYELEQRDIDTYLVSLFD